MLNEKLDIIEDGKNAVINGDIDTAIHRFRSILDENPNDADALLGMAYISFHRMDMEEGRGYLEAARQAEPNNPRVLFKIGFLSEAEDDFERAREMYEKAYENDRDNPEMKSAVERMRYLTDGLGMELHDGTNVGEHTYIKPQGFRFNIFSGDGGLVKSMKQFYRHIGKNFQDSFLYNFIAIGKNHAFMLAIVGLILMALSETSKVLGVIGIVLLCASPIVLAFHYLARFKVNKFLKEVRQHFIDETGYQLADPDRGTTELSRIVKKTSMLSMIFIYLTTRWFWFSKNVEVGVFDRVDLPKPSWWQSKKKKRLSRTKNLRNSIEDALNRHWLFHLRNSKELPNWKNGRWSDSRLYIRHFVQGEPAEEFDFRPIDNSPFIVRAIRPLYKIIGVPLGFGVWLTGIFLSATVIFAPLGEKLFDEIAPAVMNMRKPTRKKGVGSIPIKDNLVIRAELSPMRAI